MKLEQLHETAVKKKKTMDSEVTETLTAQVKERERERERQRQRDRERERERDPLLPPLDRAGQHGRDVSTGPRGKGAANKTMGADNRSDEEER